SCEIDWPGVSKHQGEFVKAFAPANAFTFVFFLLDTLSGFLAKDLQSPEMKFLNEKSEKAKNNERKLKFMKNRLTIFTTILPVLTCFAFLPQMQAATQGGYGTPADGCYPGFTTAEGCDSLSSLTTGVGNTGVGWRSLFSVSDEGFNTAVGAAALNNNLTAGGSTAVGYDALLFNDALADGFPFGWYNNGVGAGALLSNVDGYSNNAFGNDALFFNINGVANTAVGYYAL